MTVSRKVPPRREGAPRARLRDDKVAQRFIRELESALTAHVRRGKLLVLTLGAPIQVPKQAVEALTAKLLSHLDGRSKVPMGLDVLGNRVELRVVDDGLKGATKILAFVVTGGLNPDTLLEELQSIVDGIRKASKAGVRSHDDRRLVFYRDHWSADLKTYQRAFSKLNVAHGFEKILLVSDRGRAEALVG